MSNVARKDEDLEQVVIVAPVASGHRHFAIFVIGATILAMFC